MLKVGDRVKANGYTKDYLGTGVVVALVPAGADSWSWDTLRVKWAMKPGSVGGGWRERDLTKLGGA